MKLFCICDNIDTQMGMRLAGIEGVVVHDKEALQQQLEMVQKDPEIGIVLISEKLVKLCYKEIDRFKLVWKSTLIVEIPDRHGDSHVGENIKRYLQDAIGIQM